MTCILLDIMRPDYPYNVLILLVGTQKPSILLTLPPKLPPSKSLGPIAPSSEPKRIDKIPVGEEPKPNNLL